VISGTAFPGGATDYPIAEQNQLLNTATAESWVWYQIEGKDECIKQAIPRDPFFLCIGANLTLQGSFTLGSRTAFRWVGQSQDKTVTTASLTVGSAESTDPAEWIEFTEQGTAEQGGVKFARSTQLFDFSDAPFPPATFSLPSFCEK
jgi:hypothetical protein